MRTILDSGSPAIRFQRVESVVVVVVDGHPQPVLRSPNSLVIRFQASSIANGLK